MQHFIYAMGALMLAAASVLTLTPSAQAAQGLADVETTRYGGADRYATSLLVAEAVAADAGGKLDEVVMVSGRSWTDAVVSAPLAASRNAALLATPPDHLRNDAIEFLKSAGVKKVWLVGIGTEARAGGTSVHTALDSLGFNVTQVLAGDQYNLAGAVATSIESPGQMGDLGRTAFVASGEVFADALVAGPVAAQGRHPILLTPPSTLHAAARQYLKAADIEHVVLMGGTAALNAEVERSIASLDIRVTRIAGNNRFDTAVKTAKLVTGRYRDDCFTQHRAGFARARVPFDALSAGPLLGRICAPLLLVEPKSLPGETTAHIDAMRRSTARTERTSFGLHVFGGDAAVSQVAIDRYVDPALAASRLNCVPELDDEPIVLLAGRHARHPTWSPDCSRIAYIDKQSALWVANIDGSDAVKLTNGYEQEPEAEDGHPAWSPDGKRLAFSRYAGLLALGDTVHHIYVVNTDGTGERRLTSGDVYDSSPTWSPDGSQIAFSRHNLRSPRTGPYDFQDVYITVMNADGTRQTPLTSGDFRDELGIPDQYPAWSPDGQFIAYFAGNETAIIRTDGTEEQLFNDELAGGSELTWSPTGDRIAYTQSVSLEDGRVRTRLVTATPGGTEITPVVSYTGPRDDHLVIGYPRWSPDGRSILYERYRSNSGKPRVYVAPVSR